ncbi:16S rRNA (cytidine(1402)-2'-O)-methyltransferase [Rhizobiaceae bacterium BDR2-2]|uniref:Ribosomal RNA small subunit methyltransferase I n=1 Tax=Ectorhizobium quercum TaxID=2965071 RepID=A0AAE3MV42_9HYPH|nr:16S rRNA (cytidine(1402)-2'-O)-methyltransferase [Ectorhizobium quercum]MCX8995733.1 16S rRNA (cytidine(1402)-2'-O)-methyltransferase [Ectorhizobium quercum]
MTDSETAAGASEKTFRIHDHVIVARPLTAGLHLVATPIGNLGDITLRGLETLAAADVLACEDTRVTRVLLDRYGIRKRPFSYHEHNAGEAGDRLLAFLEEGKSVALVSDAGTPLVSDPGYRLAVRAIEAGHRVVPLPGASAPLAALLGSGLPNDAFLFAGFLPTRDKARRERLRELAAVPATLIFFESPHRIAATLAAAAAEYGADRPASVCRELTKTFEEFRRGPLGELAADFAERTVKGEIVLVIGPPSEEEAADPADVDRLLQELAADRSAGQAATEAARLTGLPRRQLYQRLLDLKGGA